MAYLFAKVPYDSPFTSAVGVVVYVVVVIVAVIVIISPAHKCARVKCAQKHSKANTRLNPKRRGIKAFMCVRINVEYLAIFINELSFVQVSAVTIAKSAFKWI